MDKRYPKEQSESVTPKRERQHNGQKIPKGAIRICNSQEGETTIYKTNYT
jgi:hypothetical protein